MAIILGVFLVQHLATHLLAVFGPEYHIAITEAARIIYRPVVIEALLFIALLAQIILGFLLIRRRWQLGVSGFWGWAQVISGAYLVFFILNHTIAAVTARWSMGVDTNFYWAASTLALSPLSYGFAIYYILAPTALGAHVGAALHFAGRTVTARVTLAAGILIGISIVTIFSGGLYEITLPPTYQDYAQYLRAMFGLH
ncbi:MAG: hypothetical protein ACPGGK_09015 [Pikeienuella sp.]